MAVVTSPILRCLLALLLLFFQGCGCGDDDSKEPPAVTFRNNTPYYVHVFHPEETFLYVPPGGTVSVRQHTTSGEVVVAVAPGQGPSVKATGPVSTIPAAGTTCPPYRIEWSQGALQLDPGKCPSPSGGSCPYIYSRAADGQYLIEGETLVGALNPGATREDAVVLRQAAASQGRICVRVAAELRERDVIDQAGLELIEHAAGTEVILTSEGEPLILRGLASGADTTEEGWRWSAKLRGGADTLDELRVKFVAARSVKSEAITVAVRLRNTRFIEETYHEFMRRLGPALPKAMRLASRFSFYRPMLDKLTRSGGLSLWAGVETTGGRSELTAIPPVGRAAPREVALRLPLPSQGDATLAIRALAGAWEVDRVRGTFAAPEKPIARRRLRMIGAAIGSRGSPDSAVDLEALARTDADAVEIEHRQHLEICFAAPEWPSKRGSRTKITPVLRLSGYYEFLDESWRPCVNVNALSRCLFTQEPLFASFVRSRLLAEQRRDPRRAPRGSAR